MEDQSTYLLDFPYFIHGKSTEELAESLLITTMELEATRFKAQEELKLKDDQLTQLKQLLNTTIKERNEAQDKYQLLLSTIEDEPITITNGGGFSSSDCEESILSSPASQLTTPAWSPEQDLNFPARALPEYGKFLDAVIKAGPLLQNLILAGPLPHWRHPPPPLDNYRIPPLPVVLPTPPAMKYMFGNFDLKRGLPEGSDSSTETKYQRKESPSDDSLTLRKKVDFCH